MANFLAPCRESFSCLCQFRLFIFQLTFTGGNPWPKLVPAIPFGMKSGVFFCLQFEKVFCLLRSFIYICNEVFIFGYPFHPNFKFFWGKRSLVVQENRKQHVVVEIWDFLIVFWQFIKNCFVYYAFQNLKLTEVFKNKDVNLKTQLLYCMMLSVLQWPNMILGGLLLPKLPLC